jgi:nucleoside-diphosphate-sugar epimerase
MHVFIAGGTGAIGTRLIPQLVQRGHRVTATTRDPAKLAGLDRLGATGVVVDGLDSAAVGEAVASAEPDAVVHQMSALAGKLDPKHFDRSFAVTNSLRTQGLDHLVAAAHGHRRPARRGAELHRLAQHPLRRMGQGRGGPAGPGTASGAARNAGAIQYLEETVQKEDGTVLRYGGFYGDASNAMIPLVRKRRFPLVGGGTGYASWVHLDDAASATVLALEQGARGVFNIVDDEPAPASEWLPYLADCVGAKPPLRLPVWVARLAAGEVAVSMLTRTRGSSNARAKRELGWELRWPSWRQGFRHGLANG